MTDKTRVQSETPRVVRVTPDMKALARFVLEQAGREAITDDVRLAAAYILGHEGVEPAAESEWDPGRALKDGVRHEFGERGGVNMSIEASTTFTVIESETMPKIFQGERGVKEGCYLYSRHFNPTNFHFGQRLAAMEDMKIAYPTASGMSAIGCTVRQNLEMGDEVIASGTVYGGTHALFENILPREGIGVTFVNPNNTKDFERAITLKTKIIYVETEANPTMVIADLRALAQMANAHSIALVVDNTFTPLSFTPAHMEADNLVVLYSTTKFINGMSDAVGGAICCSEEFLTKLMDLRTGRLMLDGPVMDPKNAFQLNLYLNTLPIRIMEHSRRALMYAQRMEEMGLRVYYPGLSSHPQHELATSMMNPRYGYGGMLSADFGSAEMAMKFADKLQELNGAFHAVSFGYCHTLVSVSATSTSSEVAPEDQRAMGLTPGLARLSIGFTGGLESEWKKIEEAINCVRKG